MHPYPALLLALVAQVAAQSLAPAAAAIMAPAAPKITTPAVLPAFFARLVKEEVADATVQSPHRDSAEATVQSPAGDAAATVQGPKPTAAAAAAYADADATVQGTAAVLADATVQGPNKQADATVQGTAAATTLVVVDATVQGPKPTACAAADATVQGPKQAGATVQKRRMTAFANILPTNIKQASITSIPQPPPTSQAETAAAAGATVQGPQVRSLADGDVSVQWPKKRMAIPTAAAGWLLAASP